MNAVAESILHVMRTSLRLSTGAVQVTYPGVGPVWRVSAQAASGERWAAEHEDYYRAVVMLAEAVGMELEE